MPLLPLPCRTVRRLKPVLIAATSRALPIHVLPADEPGPAASGRMDVPSLITPFDTPRHTRQPAPPHATDHAAANRTETTSQASSSPVDEPNHLSPVQATLLATSCPLIRRVIPFSPLPMDIPNRGRAILTTFFIHPGRAFRHFAPIRPCATNRVYPTLAVPRDTPVLIMPHRATDHVIPHLPTLRINSNQVDPALCDEPSSTGPIDVPPRASTTRQAVPDRATCQPSPTQFSPTDMPHRHATPIRSLPTQPTPRSRSAPD